ncbi:hypothetical protein [Anaeromassilibacillus sp. SJQ-1]|uniref:hypothetical protein n=1 Tax=Anaeromassilibacillus sp. SJQ-1 TaxID=3375419 RepID=UPI0039893BA8
MEEYKEVSERYAFLNSQVEDVEQSRDELKRLIGDFTRQMRDLFIERFQQINTNFLQTFKELFGGGTAGLSLTDPEDILRSGIEISVQPPGKIVTHLELLSGGEKALVAIALYFAIMKVSPPPFCMLDEIEAALDDVICRPFCGLSTAYDGQYAVYCHHTPPRKYGRSGCFVWRYHAGRGCVEALGVACE